MARLCKAVVTRTRKEYMHVHARCKIVRLHVGKAVSRKFKGILRNIVHKNVVSCLNS